MNITRDILARVLVVLILLFVLAILPTTLINLTEFAKIATRDAATQYLENNYNLLVTDIAGAVEGDLIPTANNTYDVGSTTKQWKDGYFVGLNAPTGRTAAVIVASNNATALQKRQADYVGTGSNEGVTITTAIAAAGSAGQVRLLSGPGGFNVSENITIPAGVTVSGESTESTIINLASGYTVRAENKGNLVNVTIKVAPNYVGNALLHDGADQIIENQGVFEGVKVVGTTNTGTGLYMVAEATVAGQWAYLSRNVYGKMTFDGLEYPIRMYVNETGGGGADAWINGNILPVLNIGNCVHQIQMIKGVGSASISANRLPMVQMQSDTATVDGVLVGGTDNVLNLNFWDWESREAIATANTSTRNEITYYSAGTNSGMDAVTDNGTKNKIQPYTGVSATRVYNSTSENITDSQDTALTWDTTMWNTAGEGHENGILHVPYDGLYLITAHVSFSSNSTGYRRVRIITGGGSVLAEDTRMAVDGAVTSFSISTVFWSSTDNSFKVTVYQTSGGNLDVVNNNYLSPQATVTLLTPNMLPPSY